MPQYKRKYTPYRYNRTRYSRPRTSTFQNYATMAYDAYKGVKYLKSLVNVEKHPLDVTVSQTPENAIGTFSLLNGVAQGDTNITRTGNSVLFTSINLNLKYTINSAASHTQIRTILFYDKECNGATPVIADILSSTNILANYNHDETTRFQKLADFMVNLSISGTQEVSRRVYRKLQKHTRFDGTSAAIGDIVDNALWLFFLSDEATNRS